jgi:hypothetical protein
MNFIINKYNLVFNTVKWIIENWQSFYAQTSMPHFLKNYLFLVTIMLSFIKLAYTNLAQSQHNVVIADVSVTRFNGAELFISVNEDA